MELDPEQPSAFNPLSGNPLATREDVLRALIEAHRPMAAIAARHGWSSFAAPGAAYDRRAQDLEALARPLWGLAAAAVGGHDDPSWPDYRAGIARAVDPASADYWGEAQPFDQRIVDLTGIAFALLLAPERVWAPLDETVRAQLADMLRQAAQQPVFDNNWSFFPVTIDAALRRVGKPGGDQTPALLERIDGYAATDGWYRDGAGGAVDHYNGFALHFYGLIHAAFAPPGDTHAAAFRERAARFALAYRHWFDDEAALPYGRSLAYRFAPAAFWGACALAGVEALPWGAMKGLYLRHLRWWRRWPIAHADGPLSIGYGYPNAQMAETYNAPASPYWAFKAFLPLALGSDHPFWAAEETAPPAPDPAPLLQSAPGMILLAEPGQTVALTTGQNAPTHIRWAPEKCAKFAYSTRYPPGIESDWRQFDACGFDNMLALANTDGDWRVRGTTEKRALLGDVAWSQWKPWRDVTVDSWVYADGPWTLRIHRIVTPYPLTGIEGGFAIARPHETLDMQIGERRALCRNGTDASGVRDLSVVPRQGRAGGLAPNTNLLHPRAVVPQLTGAIPPGETMLCCAALATPDPVRAAAWATPPTVRKTLPLA